MFITMVELQSLAFLKTYHLNIINIVFLGMTAIVVIFGSLINLVEIHLPSYIRQSFRYGKHHYRGQSNTLVNCLEVPKRWFQHFYVFSFSWSMLALFFLLKGSLYNSQAPECILRFLDLIAGGQSNRLVEIDTTTALVATVLITLQCGRRFYETSFVQIFSQKSKINLSHYVVGYVHYFGVVVALLVNTEGFVEGTLPSSFSFSKLSLLQKLCIFIFFFCWTQQYKSHMILVNLRKDAKSGNVITEHHLLPRGGFFQLISSPHMFFEVVIYLALLGILYKSMTWYPVTLWVASNQTINALLTHKWYKDSFKNYPKNRRALIPFVL